MSSYLTSEINFPNYSVDMTLLLEVNRAQIVKVTALSLHLKRGTQFRKYKVLVINQILYISRRYQIDSYHNYQENMVPFFVHITVASHERHGVSNYPQLNYRVVVVLWCVVLVALLLIPLAYSVCIIAGNKRLGLWVST